MSLRNVVRSGFLLLRASIRREAVHEVKSACLRQNIQPTRNVSSKENSLLFGLTDTVAARWRKYALRNLFPTGARRFPQTYTPFLTLGFAGIAWVKESKECNSTSDFSSPLEVCCNLIKTSFQGQNGSQQDEVNFPSTIHGYEMSKILAKGTNGVVYLAHVKPSNELGDEDLEHDIEISEGSSEGSVPVNDIEISEGSTDGSLSVSETSSFEICSESGEEKNSSSEHSDFEVIQDDQVFLSIPSSLSSLQNTSEEGSDFEIIEEITGYTTSESETSNTSLKEFEVDSSIEGSSIEKISYETSDNEGSVGGIGSSTELAVKMIFNYNIESNCEAIETAYEAEKIPLIRHSCDRSPDCDSYHIPPHPNMVKIYEAFVDDNNPPDLEEARRLFNAALPPSLASEGYGRNKTMYLVMKKYTMTLRQYLAEYGPLSSRSAMLIIVQLLEGVAHLNQYGVAHRDLKTDNILVEITKDGECPSVVISDFGCAFIGMEMMVYRYSTRGGNQALMAPEIKNAQVGDLLDFSKSDAWAVGAIAYEILGLPNPFYKDGQNLESKNYKMSNLPPLPSYIDDGLKFVVTSLLEKDPSQRPRAQEAASMLHLLLWQHEFWQQHFLAIQWEPSSLSYRLMEWLINVCQYHFSSQRNAEGANTEKEICKTFLKRVTKEDLSFAASLLLKHHSFRFLEEIITQFGTISCNRSQNHSELLQSQLAY